MLSIVIVNWNAGDVLPDCLESIRRQELDPRPEVIIWDNDSSDGSDEMLAESPLVTRFIPAGENIGFAQGNNRAAEYATGELLFFLNPDTVLQGTDCLARIAGALDDPTIGLVGPMLLNVDGTIQKSVGGFPSLRRGIIAALGIHRLLPDRKLARFAPMSWSQSSSADVDWVRGAAMMLRAGDFRELGGFSEATFMYAEDSELCFRVHRAGKRVRYATDAKIMHIDDHSSSKRWTDTEKAAIVMRADIAFLRDNYSAPRAWAIRATWILAAALRSAIFYALGKRERGRFFAALARSAAGA
jgi:GT2 family glycosyltransferase